MTAIDRKLEDAAMVAELDLCLRTLDDGKVRRRIVDHYLCGWCTAEFALQTLIGLQLIEHTPGVHNE